MIIEQVDVDVLEVPVERPYVAGGGAVTANWHVLVRIRTRGGAEGFGYVVKLGPQFIGTIAHATRELGELLVGRNVLDSEASWSAMSSAGKFIGPGGLMHWAMAPLDIAMWDAAGHALGQPLYRLLGGMRNAMPVYASDELWYSLTLDELATNAAAYAAEGFPAIKLRLGGQATAKEQAERVRAARTAAGDAVDVMVDGTESWDLPYARTAARALQDAGATWLEDPVHHENLAGLAGLSQILDIPVTGGENLYTLSQFRRSLDAGAFDVCILDLFRVGGITPWRKIAALASAFHVPISGHVVPEIHTHLLAATPNARIVEYMPRSNTIVPNAPTPVAGVLTLSERPGHGLALDAEAFKRCRVNG
jgi:L-alanine-DL-glutamate epimerase-like enolase superfamily enzyme